MSVVSVASTFFAWGKLTSYLWAVVRGCGRGLCCGGSAVCCIYMLMVERCNLCDPL